MENYNKSKSLNFIKYIINKANIRFREIILHSNSNIHISSMNHYLKECNGLSVYSFNDELKKTFKSKCIDELNSGLTVVYTAKQKNILLVEIHRSLEEKLFQSEKMKNYKKMQSNKKRIKWNNIHYRLFQFGSRFTIILSCALLIFLTIFLFK